MADGITFGIDKKSISDSFKTIKRLEKSVKDEKFWRSTHRKGLNPIAAQMKSNSKSARIARAIGVTTAKTKTLPNGASVGVVKNIPSEFPKFTAQATAAVVEYGTDERFRETGFFKEASTGVMPADPFLRPAWNGGVGSYMKYVESTVVKRVEKEANK